MIHNKRHDCSDLNLLAVDDDPMLLKFFKIHFGNSFDSVVVVPRAQEALQVMADYPVDVVISDYEMPGKNGLWLLHQLKLHHPTVTCLLISGAPLSDEQEARVVSCADSYLRKPFEIDALHQSLMEVVKLRRSFIHKQAVEKQLRRGSQAA